MTPAALARVVIITVLVILATMIVALPKGPSTLLALAAVITAAAGLIGALLQSRPPST